MLHPLLSHLAHTDLRTATKGLRGDFQELFRRNPDGTYCNKITFAVEILLNPVATDPWGATVTLSHSRVRYELELEGREDERGIERIVVAREEAKPILVRDDAWPRSKRISPKFKEAYIKSSRRNPWLTTDEKEGKRSFRIYQDSRQGRDRPAESAEATVLSSITSADFPHLYALREKMLSWRFLQLDPVALRRPSSILASQDLEPDGSNLPTVLARIQAETSTERQPKGELAGIAADLTGLIPGVIGLEVKEDTSAREYQVEIEMREGPPFSSRVVSDGTLRILALLTFLHDPKYGGVICFEEPENGVHPFRLKAMIHRLRSLVSDPSSEDVNSDDPLSQMLLNSHSPVILSSLDQGEMLFADVVSISDHEHNQLRRKTRIRPVKLQQELFPGENRDYVTRSEVENYLNSVDREG